MLFLTNESFLIFQFPYVIGKKERIQNDFIGFSDEERNMILNFKSSHALELTATSDEGLSALSATSDEGLSAAHQVDSNHQPALHSCDNESIDHEQLITCNGDLETFSYLQSSAEYDSTCCHPEGTHSHGMDSQDSYYKAGSSGEEFSGNGNSLDDLFKIENVSSDEEGEELLIDVINIESTSTQCHPLSFYDSTLKSTFEYEPFGLASSSDSSLELLPFAGACSSTGDVTEDQSCT